MSHRTIRMIIEEQEPVTAPATLTVSEAARLMRERRVGAIMVVQEGALAGIFTERDACTRARRGRECRPRGLADVIPAIRNHTPGPLLPEGLQMMYGGSFRQCGGGGWASGRP